MPSTDPAPGTDPEIDDDRKLAGYAETLIDGLNLHVPAWVERTLTDRLQRPFDLDASPATAAAVTTALAAVGELLRTDVDAQVANPLAIIRSLVPSMTAVLVDGGVPAVGRDPDAEWLFPDDHYDLTPGNFSDLHPDLHLPGLTWGAAKAHVHLQRRRTESEQR